MPSATSPQRMLRQENSRRTLRRHTEWRIEAYKFPDVPVRPEHSHRLFDFIDTGNGDLANSVRVPDLDSSVGLQRQHFFSNTLLLGLLALFENQLENFISWWEKLAERYAQDCDCNKVAQSQVSSPLARPYEKVRQGPQQSSRLVLYPQS